MIEWRECRLLEITEPVKDTYLPNVSDELNYIGLEHIEQETLRLNRIGKSSDVTSNKFLFQKNDVLFGKLRPYFRKVFKPNFSGICSTDIWVFKAKNGFSQDFIFYFLANWDFVDTANSGEGGTRMPRADWNFLKSTLWNVPALPEQKAIAAVLSSLDDKIDLLHRQNQTLEAMAETLFRQWFVVEAREDWEEYAISDFADHIKINVIPSKNADTIFHHYSLPAYDSGQKPTIEIGSEILSNKYTVIENSILVSKLNPRFPRIWAISSLHKQIAICSTEFQVLKPKSESLFGYLYFLLHSNDVKEELTMASSGTSGSHQRVKPEDIFNVKTLLPSVSQAEKFSNQVLPNIKKIEANRIQIRTLETLRDTLLPKLMSGEVRVAV
jgi:type I restriction enzyme S subunit